MFNKIQKWKEVFREKVFCKYRRGMEKVDFKILNGEVSDFYLKKENPVVAVVAIIKDQMVILVKQFRPGPKEILTELPGGYIDKNETSREAGE